MVYIPLFTVLETGFYCRSREKKRGRGGQRKERLIDKLRWQLATGARGEAITTALEAKIFKRNSIQLLKPSRRYYTD